MKSSSVLAVHVDFLSPDVRAKRTVLYALGHSAFISLLTLQELVRIYG